MELRWTEVAATDLERIGEFLLEETPYHGSRLVSEIFEASQVLLQFPYRGRPGRKVGTRELVLPSLPYLVIYTVSDDTIHVVRILHGAQKYP